MSTSKKKSLSLKDKVQILKAVDSSVGQHGLKGRIAKEFEIVNSTLSSIIKDKKKIIFFLWHGQKPLLTMLYSILLT